MGCAGFGVASQQGSLSGLGAGGAVLVVSLKTDPCRVPSPGFPRFSNFSGLVGDYVDLISSVSSVK